MKPSPARSPWWLAVALLLGLQAGLLLRPAPQPAVVRVLLPVLPVSGAEIEADLAAEGLLLPGPPPDGELDSFGASLARGLDGNAWLGPTIGSADVLAGLRALGSAGHGLNDSQRSRLEPSIARLEALRDELELSEGRMAALARDLACAREALLSELDQAQRERLLGAARGPGGER